MILALEKIEQRAALVDHHQKAAARMIILRVGLEMAGQRVDAIGDDRDLDFGGPRVAVAAAMLLDQFLLTLCSDRHHVTP